MNNVLLIGFSGSGKTSLANHISENFGQQQIVSSDVIHAKLRALPVIGKFFKIGETNINSASYKSTQIITKIVQMIDMIIKSHSRLRIVYDACNLQEKTRQKILKILGEDTIIIHIKTDEQILLERLKARENPDVWIALYKEQKQNVEIPEKVDIIHDNTHLPLGDFDDFDKKFSELINNS